MTHFTNQVGEAECKAEYKVDWNPRIILKQTLLQIDIWCVNYNAKGNVTQNMVRTNKFRMLVKKALFRFGDSQIPPVLAWTSVLVALIVSSIQPVAAQSAIEEGARVACSGALGRGVFLVFGLLALGLILGGVLQLGAGFFKMGSSGGMRHQASGRNGLVNGGLTLAGGLFLGSVGALLSYLGVDISHCLNADNILWAAPIGQHIGEAFVFIAALV